MKRLVLAALVLALCPGTASAATAIEYGLIAAATGLSFDKQTPYLTIEEEVAKAAIAIPIFVSVKEKASIDVYDRNGVLAGHVDCSQCTLDTRLELNLATGLYDEVTTIFHSRSGRVLFLGVNPGVRAPGPARQ